MDELSKSLNYTCDSNEDNSKKILTHIKENPGIHLRQIKNDLDISLGTVRHHLNSLEKNGIIISEKNNFYKHYFSVGTFPENERNMLKVLHNETSREILLYLLEKKTVHQNELVENIGITAASINWHAKRLNNLGIITVSKKGKHVIYQLAINPQYIVMLLKNYHQTVWRRWGDRLSEMFLSISGDPEND